MHQCSSPLEAGLTEKLDCVQCKILESASMSFKKVNQAVFICIKVPYPHRVKEHPSVSTNAVPEFCAIGIGETDLEAPQALRSGKGLT